MGLVGAITCLPAFLLLPLPAISSEVERWRRKIDDSLGLIFKARSCTRPIPINRLQTDAMTKKTLTATILFVLALTLALAYSARDDIRPGVVRFLSSERNWFGADPLATRAIEQIFDMGIVDANQDGLLDIYTSNHNYRQVLWIADGQGGFRDSLSAWGLDQIKAFPGWEQSMQPPTIDKQGLYVYWVGDTIHMRAHQEPPSLSV